jgi:hypothetical protein
MRAYMRPMKVTGLNGMTIDEAWKEKIYSHGGIALPGFPNLFMLYGPFAPVNNAGAAGPRPGDRLHHVAHGRITRPQRRGLTDSRRTEKFLARLGTAFPGTVWVGGCKNWYTSQQPTPVQKGVRAVSMFVIVKASWTRLPPLDPDLSRCL